MITLRPYQHAAVDAIYGYFNAHDGHPLIVLPTGCHAAGTKILMFDGSTKNVEYVAVGDLLMGPDSQPREVLRLARGREALYRINPKKGEPFVVNEGHILSLQTTNEGKRYPCNTTGFEIENIELRELLKKSKSWKHLRKLRRVAVDFPNLDDPPLSPWCIGVLLGDGCIIRGVYVSNPDIEVLDEICAEMEGLGLRASAYQKLNNKAWDVHFADPGANRGAPNRVMSILRQLDIAGCRAENKFVPDICKLGSRRVRREVLAGLIDTDGHYDGGCFDFISKSKRLSEDVVFIARSLGLWAKISECRKFCQNGGGGTYWRVPISGDLDVIPTRVKRKRATPRLQRKNPLVTGFAVEPVGNGEFFGFEIDGDHLYLTGDFIVHHNTGKSIVIAEFMRRAISDFSDTRILCVTHVKELIAQNFSELVRLWPEAPAGIHSAGLNRRDVRSQILFCGIQSVHKKAYDIQQCDLVLIDECHLLPRTSNTMYRRFLKDLTTINPALKVVGFTATPFRLDSGMLHKGDGALFTDIAYDAKIDVMIKHGYLCEVITRATKIAMNVSGVGTRGGEFVPGQLERAVDTDPLNSAIVDEIVSAGVDRKSWLMFCAGVDHAHHVRDVVRARGISCETIVGDTPSADRDRIIARFKAGKIRALTNANVLTTGFNAPGVDLIAMLRPTQSTGLYIQMIGRGARTADGKDNCLVLDFAGNIRRHGPIDRVDVRAEKVDGDGEAPIKTCPSCYAIVFAGVRACPYCGYEFPAPVVELERKPAKDAILSHQIKAEWADVSSVTYRRHEKIGKPPSMRVDYRCGMVRHSEWICFEHAGYALEKAVDWWRKRSSAPPPRTVGEALMEAPTLPQPSRICVRPVGKFTDIMGYDFGGGEKMEANA